MLLSNFSTFAPSLNQSNVKSALIKEKNTA